MSNEDVTKENNDMAIKAVTDEQIKIFRLMISIALYIVMLLNLLALASGNIMAILSLAISIFALVAIIKRYRIAIIFVRIWSAGLMLYGAGAFLKSLGEFLQGGVIVSAFTQLAISIACILIGTFIFANAPSRLGISKNTVTASPGAQTDGMSPW